MSILVGKHSVEKPPTDAGRHTTSQFGPVAKQVLLFLIPVVVGVVIWFIPAPQGVKPVAWHLLAIFIATIVGIIVKPLPMGAVALIGMTMTVLTGVLPVTTALSGFSNSTIWLIVLAFFIARGFIKTGLGQRIGYLFVALLGRRTLGLSYGLIASDLVLAPAIPSNTARAGGVVYPIMKSVAHAYGSDPQDGTARKLGSFLTTAIFQGNMITSAMFLTAMAANPLAVKLAADLKIQISWGQWALAALIPGLVSLIVVPFVLYKLYPPEVKQTPNAAQFAKEKLAEMGRMTRNEWLMLGAFVLLLVLWIFGGTFNLDATTAALIGLGALLVVSVLTWDDIRREEGAWDTLVWFAALVMMATTLNSLGLIPWLSHHAASAVGVLNWVIELGVLLLVYFYSHYLFDSNTAHVSAMYAGFLAAVLAVGAPPLLAALVFGFASNLFGCMTHYGSGPAPVLFGSGYVDVRTWWKLGLIISIVNILIWAVVGAIWWKVLGLY
jgi:DASS family divalent anion:Na+ symporter